MKNLHSPLNIFFAGLLLALAGCASQKNTLSVNTDYSKLVQEQQFTFVARNVIPTEDARFNVRQMFPQAANLYNLTTRYDLRITPDSITAFLPFFGRAFNAPIDPTKGGFKFTSTKFDYNEQMRKKMYQITITPKDVQDVRNIYLSISPSGYASIQILSTNRTPISFNGIIEENQ